MIRQLATSGRVWKSTLLSISAEQNYKSSIFYLLHYYCEQNREQKQAFSNRLEVEVGRALGFEFQIAELSVTFESR